MPHPTLEAAKAEAARLVAFMVANPDVTTPCALEVVKTGRGVIEVQPFGLHALFKSHKVLHIEPLPAATHTPPPLFSGSVDRLISATNAQRSRLLRQAR